MRTCAMSIRNPFSFFVIFVLANRYEIRYSACKANLTFHRDSCAQKVIHFSDNFGTLEGQQWTSLTVIGNACKKLFAFDLPYWLGNMIGAISGILFYIQLIIFYEGITRT